MDDDSCDHSLAVGECDDAKLVEKERVRLADGECRLEVITGDRDILELEMLHADEKQRKMGSRGSVRTYICERSSDMTVER